MRGPSCFLLRDHNFTHFLYGKVARKEIVRHLLETISSYPSHDAVHVDLDRADNGAEGQGSECGFLASTTWTFLLTRRAEQILYGSYVGILLYVTVLGYMFY